MLNSIMRFTNSVILSSKLGMSLGVFWLLFAPFAVEAQSSITPLAAKPTLTFAAIDNLAEQEIAEPVLLSICRKLDFNCQVEFMPAKRAEREVNAGDKVGEILRVWDYGVRNQSLIRVPTAYYQLQTAVFSLAERQIQINDISDLGEYRIGVVRGVKHTEFVSMYPRQVLMVNDSEQLFSLLQNDRVDVVLTSRIDGERINKVVMQKVNAAQFSAPLQPYRSVVINDPLLAEQNLYFYLHPNYIDLQAPFDKTLQEMKLSGELARIIKQAEKQFTR